MSWRSILIIIVLALAAAGFSGMQLGDWLVSRAPTTAPPPHATGADAENVLDADGRPYVAQPPQPRLDGTLGVPDTLAAEWDVPMVSLFDTVNDPNVMISREKATPESLRLLTHGASPLPSDTRQEADTPPPADIRDIQAALAGDPGYPPVASPNPAHPTSGAGNWQAALRRELQVCADTMGFFERPSCAWAARRKYCEPNNAWGTIRECPERR
ncbi:hypothetical protein NJI34_08775 [Pseudomonas sp. S 311-6]|uniref:hypothetical protein n=1 Tax=Kerstersia gyiorum TaxID=206506 RepID=UPI0020975FB3|nr:hypothetical protein [Pseudomonas sp. S 311-6]